MKIIKWNSRKLTESKTTFDIPLIKNFEPYITWLTQRLTGSRILFLYTTTDCTHSLNCVGVLPVIFLPSLRPRNYIYLTSARSSVQNLSFTTRRRFALLRLLREIKNSKKLKKYIFAQIMPPKKRYNSRFPPVRIKKIMQVSLGKLNGSGLG